MMRTTLVRRILVGTALMLLLLSAGCGQATESDVASDSDTGPEQSDSSAQDTADDATGVRYPVVDTGQDAFFDETGEISEPAGGAFFGQDAHYAGNTPSYTDNGDGTVTDEVTGLMWEQGFRQVSFDDAAADAGAARTGGYDDWRVPTIKELYSLILFSGNQGSAPPDMATAPDDAVPFLDTDVFDFEFASTGRYIDAQYLTDTLYTSTTMGGARTFFGVNFADGRIKGYPTDGNPQRSEYYARYVRGDAYGENDFVDNGDGTVTDLATGLMWTQADSGEGYAWEQALHKAESLSLGGYDDWRLPNAKELHTIVDYTRSPDHSGTPAIDPVFDSTAITNEAGEEDWPHYWTSTTFLPGRDAVYIAFGRGLGYFSVGGQQARFMDVHGAGCQRTDPKVGEPAYGRGPQGDVQRVENYLRLVRDTE